MELTVDAALRNASSAFADRTFLRFAEGDLTFVETDRRVNALAHGLKRLGVGEGSHIALLMRNRAEFVLSWFAANRLGAAVVPVNTEFRGVALARVLNHSAATVLIADPELFDPVVAIAGQLASLERVVFTEPATDNTLTDVPEQIVAMSLSELTAIETDAPHPNVSRPAGRAMIMFTSGTTGPSKGCVLSNRYVVRQAELLAQNYELDADDVLYCPFPLFHLDAAVLTVMPALVLGGTAALGRRFSASHFWEEIRAFQATVFDFMGATLTILHKQPPRSDDEDNPVRLAWGVPVPDYAADFEGRFKLRLVELYGSTDVGVPIYEPLDEPRRQGSCGRPIPEYEVAIFSEDDTRTSPGEVGELVVRPREPHLITDGYLGMPSETVQAARNLWWHTGDLASQDDGGFIYFVGRKTDSIRRRGENISAFEVEEVVKSHSAVLDAAAYPVPSELTEDDVMISVVARQGHDLQIEDLLDYCAQHMAAYMVPRYIDVVDELPHTPTAKISKVILIERGVTATTYDRERAIDSDG